MAAVYQGSLNLTKVTGLRVDKNQVVTKVPVKKSTKLPVGPRSMKTTPNVKNGEKY